MKHILQGRSGFTLIEILFVLLVIAMIINFSMPAFRKVRFSIKNGRAQAALSKLGEARLSFFQNTKGWDITPGTSFTGSDTKTFSSQTCTSPALVGIPPSRSGDATIAHQTVAPSQLFACGFLNWRDFADLPYTFYICSIKEKLPDTPGCNVYDALASAAGSASEVGDDYGFDTSEPYFMLVDRWKRIYTSKDPMPEEYQSKEGD